MVKPLNGIRPINLIPVVKFSDRFGRATDLFGRPIRFERHRIVGIFADRCHVKFSDGVAKPITRFRAVKRTDRRMAADPVDEICA
jgi:hypothetical protein